MRDLRSIPFDCCATPKPVATGFSYHTHSGEWWALLRCDFCGRHWCHSRDLDGAEWFSPLLGSFEPTPALKLGPGLNLDAVRQRVRSLRVTTAAQAWIDPSSAPADGRHSVNHTLHPLVTKAREFAVTSHDACGHTRSDGTPYWTHPERVVNTLAAHGLPAEVLAAAWLHDVAEDCPADEAGSRELLARMATDFGAEVASLVTEVTNYFGEDATMEEKQARLREHARTMSDGAKWVKLADRLDNITGMVGWSPEKRRRYAASTLLLLEALRPWPKGSDSLAGQIAEAAAKH